MRLKELPSNNDAAILGRVIQSDHEPMSPAAARALVKFDFPARDRQRMHELVVKNQDGTLTAAENSELDSYRRVGRLVDLVVAKARRA